MVQNGEQNMLKAALVSWAVTHVMDNVLSLAKAMITKTWEKAMKQLKKVIMSAKCLVVNTICSSAIVVGVCLEWLAHVARAVGTVRTVEYYKRTLLRGNPLTANHSAIFLGTIN